MFWSLDIEKPLTSLHYLEIGISLSVFRHWYLDIGILTSVSFFNIRYLISDGSTNIYLILALF